MTDKKKQLQKHKRIATGLFLLMAVVYIIMVYAIRHSPASWMGYVKAFSEAAMVGALADWFAVTALFRHPMGVPIPHTNLIVNSKNKIGDNLGDFITDNFLTADNIRPYVEKVDLANMISTWLNKPSNQAILESEITSLTKRILTDLNDDSIIHLMTAKAKEGIAAINIQGFVSKGLMYAIEKNEHNRLLDIILPKAQVYVEEHRQEIYDNVVEKKPILGLIGGKAVTNQLISGINTFLGDIERDPHHKIRKEITLRLEMLAVDIEASPVWKAKFDEIISQFITDKTIDTYMRDLWASTKENLLHQLEDKNSTLRSYISSNLSKIAIDLENNTENKAKINKWIQYTIYRVALKNTKEVGQLIRNTVESWDGQELSDKLELEVGKDLQYIRINGTLVGGLVGLLIYIITSLL
ncbi:DUF445 domain-containing protein [Myroides marinus]|uniref:DUF445 domain-containing protein n=1 Tax=Myroides marinus TaxID=703342 RepID=UPI002575294D|nr:DUF445 domain-containing protein [Myroides marinus]MDM1345988.1 DUF445 domain-containing protein [Myroides marinus]MDM1353171.1 DUF445 domain-containing protein [Myroides marinus]MDM1360741.1 DUF445 domain-containing protein [Myroides marinus]MDM1377409.1 DUF445 domain-containing protein [Myroides marinus]MDM1384911.1 DUF445 domain-containing protein [Myroides marinus]